MDQEVARDATPKKLRVASTTPDGTLHYNRRWGEFAAFGSIMVLAAGITAGITLRARKNVADEEKDMQAAVPHDTTPLPVAAEIKMIPGNVSPPNEASTTRSFHSVAQDTTPLPIAAEIKMMPGNVSPPNEAFTMRSFPSVAQDTTPLPIAAEIKVMPGDVSLPNEAFTMRSFHSVAQGQLASFQNAATSDPIVSDSMSVGCNEYTSATAEPKQSLENAVHAQKEAADAKRKWLKMHRKLRRTRRHKQLQYLQRMRRMRLRQLKAARLQMKRKMQTDFGIDTDPGLEKRISEEKTEDAIPMQLVGRDPHRELTLMMRLLRLLHRAQRSRRVRRTYKKKKLTQLPDGLLERSG